MTSLSVLIVQDEFPQERFGTIISLIVAFNQLTFAFGPGVLGIIRDVTGSYTTSLLLCILLHSIAAGVVLLRHHVNAPKPYGVPPAYSQPELPKGAGYPNVCKHPL